MPLKVKERSKQLSRRTIYVLAGLLACSIAVFGLVFGGAPTQAQSKEGKQSASTGKLSAELRADFGKARPNSKIRYLAVLAEQANAENNIRDWNAKGWYVYNTLKGVADRTQPPVRTFLDSQKRAGNVDKYKGYYIINALAVWGNLSSAEALANLPEISRVDAFPTVNLDEPLVAKAANSPNAIEWNVSHIRAPQAWALGYTGVGVTVGSVDTGARYTHQAIVRQYRGNLGGTFDHNYNWWPAVGSSQVPVDDSASSFHGSHTIGTIVGEDASQTNQIGVAPGAKWIATNGIASGATDPDIIEAGQWMAAPTDLTGSNPDPARRPRIVSNSWGYGGSSFNCTTATFYRAVVQNWRAAGIFPSFSAGNAGTTGNRPPSAYPETFESGSIDVNWNISSFSSRGPSCFDAGRHPQVVTGGSNVRSVNGGGDTGYSLLSGTSMAQPATAGSVAVLLQANPNLTVPELWYILTSTAVMTPGWGIPPSNTYGWGVVQLDAAVLLAIQMGGPTHTPTVTNTPCSPVPCTNTPTRTPTHTFTATNTLTPTPTPCGQYNYVTATGTIVPGTTNTGSACDDCSVAIAIPFPFTLYGQTYNSVNAISNGNLQFVTSNTAFTNACLPAATHGVSLHPHWDDLRTDGTTCTGGCGIFTSTSGSTPNRIFNIEAYRTGLRSSRSTSATPA
jgi:subtilisin family serine protease